MNGIQILTKINEQYIWLLLAILMVNLTQRRSGFHTDKKRLATVFLAILCFLYEIFLIIILQRKWPAWVAIPSLIPVIVLGIVFRAKVWPFKTHCKDCGKKLSFTESISIDENVCTDCYYIRHPKEKKEKPKTDEEIEHEKIATETDCNKIDWDNWQYSEDCVITYLFRKNEETNVDELLMIKKKTGRGKGLINVPGGHIEAGETGIEAAIREFKEEVGLDISDLEKKGVLHFQFLNSNGLRGQVYFCYNYSGNLIETEEAEPFWCDVNSLPYDKMWADDAKWLPLAIEGTYFNLYSIFDGEQMLSYKIEKEEKAEA